MYNIESLLKKLNNLNKQLEKVRVASPLDLGWQSGKFANVSRKWDELSKEKFKVISQINKLGYELGICKDCTCQLRCVSVSISCLNKIGEFVDYKHYLEWISFWWRRDCRKDRIIINSGLVVEKEYTNTSGECYRNLNEEEFNEIKISIPTF